MPEEGWKTPILLCISLHVCVYTLTLFIYHGTYPLTLCNSVFLYIHSYTPITSKTNALPVASLFCPSSYTGKHSPPLCLCRCAHRGHFRSYAARNGLKWLPSPNICQSQPHCSKQHLTYICGQVSHHMDRYLFSQSEARQFCPLSYAFPD